MKIFGRMRTKSPLRRIRCWRLNSLKRRSRELLIVLTLRGPLSQMTSLLCFTQNSGKLSKGDFMPLVRGFEKREINLARLNYVRIVLIPKEDAISFINCSFKIFAKAMNNRLEGICNRLLAPNQIAFVKGRFILESMVAAHEIIHEAIRSKEKGVVLKLDYDNAYDRVSWQFLEEMLVSKGFGSKWISWIMSMIKGGGGG
jgi:hypothetical protein